MIHKESVVEVSDNSGAKKAKCIGHLGGTGKRWSSVGDVIVVSVQKVLPNSKITKGSVFRAVIVRGKKAVRRKDGSTLCFDDNAVVLVNRQNEPIGTRVFGIVSRELRSKKFVKIVSLAKEVM